MLLSFLVISFRLRTFSIIYGWNFVFVFQELLLLSLLFWPFIGHQMHGNLLFLSICCHFWISKQIDSIATVPHNHFLQILPFFCHLFAPIKSYLASAPAACFSNVQTHICITFQCLLIPFVFFLLVMDFHISFTIKPLIYWYSILDHTII